MPILLIAWHSRTGTARALAEAVRDGALASTEAVTVRLIAAGDVSAEDALAADGLVLACPENLASMSGVMKDMADRLYYPLLGRIEGRAYALVIASGTDGEGAVRQWQRIATGWRLKPVAEPIIVCTHAQTPEAILAPKQIGAEDLERCRALGQALATGLALGVF